MIDGKKLVALRKRLVLSQEELAQEIGMSKNNLSGLERDVRGMQNEYFRNLATVAKMSLDELRRELSPLNYVEGGIVELRVEMPLEVFQKLEAASDHTPETVQMLALRLIREGLERRK